MERRIRRSPDPSEALSLFLDSARKRLRVRAITVSTQQGELIAGAGIGLQRVAAIGAKVDCGVDSPALLTRSIATWRIQVGERRLLVTSLGRRMTADLGEGVRRILSS
jgi:hypothetical protein